MPYRQESTCEPYRKKRQWGTGVVNTRFFTQIGVNLKNQVVVYKLEFHNLIKLKNLTVVIESFTSFQIYNIYSRYETFNE